MGPETLPALRAKDSSKEDVPFTHLFKESKRLDSVSEEFDAEFDWEYVPSHANKEILFHHRPTRTLIEADYLFNSPSTEQFSKTGVDAESGIFTKIFGALTSTQGKFPCTTAVLTRVIFINSSLGLLPVGYWLSYDLRLTTYDSPSRRLAVSPSRHLAISPSRHLRPIADSH